LTPRAGALMHCVRMLNSANDRFDETVRMSIEPRFYRKYLMPFEAGGQENCHLTFTVLGMSQ
jgi:hypothetical protein